MSNPRILPDLAYVDGNTIAASWFQTVDSAQTAGLDGDAGGGTWNPSAAIQIGGAGMGCAGVWTLSPPSTGTVQVPITSSSPLVHNDSDYIVLATSHPLSERSIHTELALGKDSSGCPTLQTYVAPGGGMTGAVMGPTSVMIPTAAMTSPVISIGMINWPIAASPYRPGGRIVAPISVHHGATFTGVRFYFVLSSTHSGQPDVLPQFRVHKVDIAGNLTPLFSGTPNGSGFVEMNWPGSLGAYLATTFFGYSCDAGVIVDTTKFSYFVEIIDESGANAVPGNVFLSAWSEEDDIPDMRPQ